MLFFIAVILFVVIGRNMPADQAKSLVGKLVFGYLGLMALTAALFAEPGAALIVAAVLGSIFYKKYKNKVANGRAENYGWNSPKSERNVYEEAARKSSESFGRGYNIVSKILPGSVKKRYKVVEQFSDKYKLYLTKEQIERIVNATYMSEMWKREVEAMTIKYPHELQWFSGPTRWLRAYLHAFTVQDVTSDFAQQDRIVTTAFREVFEYSDTLKDISMEERINRVNDRFYTQFNDTTFMIAYRFLEEKGEFHNIDAARPVKDSNPMEDLERKYAGTSVEG